MKASPEMKRRAIEVLRSHQLAGDYQVTVLNALEMAVSPYELAPFALDEEETDAVDYVTKMGGHGALLSCAKILVAALERATRTLSHALSQEEREAVDMFCSTVKGAVLGSDHVRMPAYPCNILPQLFERHFGKPAPKPMHRVAFEASIASKHQQDSDEYWQDIVGAVMAAERGASK